ncbi:MAG: hypothetical protein R3F59_31655 [Myxococcota bacterium]|nr:hypothetical protein [Myxococcales bacterium]
MAVITATAASCSSEKLPAQPTAHKLPASALDELLAAQGLTFAAPEGFVAAPPTTSERWPYVHAIKSESRPVEVRYGPLTAAGTAALQRACGEDTRCRTTPSKAALEDILKASVSPLAAEGAELRVNPFPLDAVRGEFKAHWGGAAAFSVDPEVAPLGEALAVILHREGVGDAMFVTFMAEVDDANEDERMRAFHSLRFAAPMLTDEARARAAPLLGTTWSCSDGAVQMRFVADVWTTIHVSMAMAVMGRAQAYETITAQLEYLPDHRFTALPLRVDNMEMGDRTPKEPTAREYRYKVEGDALELRADGEETRCALIERRE